MTREELRDALVVLIDVFKNPHGTLTPDYGEICGDGFQMMTMHPDPVAVANALSRLPDILAALATPDQAVMAERDDWWRPEPHDPYWMLEVRQGFENAGQWLKNVHSGLTTADATKAIRYPSKWHADVARRGVPFNEGKFEPTEHAWIEGTV